MTENDRDQSGHIPAFERSRIACQDVVPSAQERAHLDTCSVCTQSIEREAVEVRAAQYEAVPSALLAFASRDKVPARATSRILWGMTGAFAAFAAVLVALNVGQPQPVVRYKGTPGLTVTVQRDGQIVIDDQALESVDTLRADDRVRFHVVGKPGTWLAFQVDEEGTWVDYFKGDMPADGWLPFAMLLTDPPVAPCQLFVCDAPPTTPLEEAVRTGHCALHPFTVGHR